MREKVIQYLAKSNCIIFVIGREEQVRLARMAIEDLSPDLSDSCDSCDSGDEEDEVQQFVLSESDISEAELEELQEGTTPVSSVRRAKNTQVDRVNTKGETKLQEAAIQGIHTYKYCECIY